MIELEKEVLALRAKHEKGTNKPIKHILPKEVWAQEEEEVREDGAKRDGWFSRISSYFISKKENAGEIEATMSTARPAEKILAVSDAALALKRQMSSEEAEREKVKNTAEKEKT